MTPLPVLDCDDCGKCCATQGSPPFVVLHPTLYQSPLPPGFLATHPEVQRWQSIPAEALRVLRDYFAAGKFDRYDWELPCLWFDITTKQCKWYDWRPDVCRDFEVGGESCLAYRSDTI